ncbi:MAG: LD-carboxypeptidase [Sodaliphilus sp.]|nr:LD-carboxypeptidase [Sodaliphilus sp.]
MSKSIFAILLVAIFTISANAAKNPKAPAFLKPGDKIALLSPGSTPPAWFPDSGASVLRQWGFTPVIGKNATAEYHMYAGTTAQRKADLMAALRDPSVKAILCNRGGYGSSLLLCEIPLDTLRRYPKWIIGYSDITALHSAEVRADNMSIHASMVGSLASRGATDSVNLLLRSILMGQFPTYNLPGHPYNHPGTAKGILVGGNMAVFSNIAGSNVDFLDRDYVKNHDIILFFEDVSESMSRVNSMLTQLKLKGVLRRVKGIIIGRFTDYSPSYGYTDMNQLLHEYLAGYNIPICYDFPASHDESHNLPLIEGCPVTLNVSTSSVSLKFEQPSKR